MGSRVCTLNLQICDHAHFIYIYPTSLMKLMIYDIRVQSLNLQNFWGLYIVKSLWGWAKEDINWHFITQVSQRYSMEPMEPDPPKFSTLCGCTNWCCVSLSELLKNYNLNGK